MYVFVLADHDGRGKSNLVIKRGNEIHEKLHYLLGGSQGEMSGKS
jgi:hypothetical protein